MKIIGLSGGSGSGKGTVSKLFLDYGIHSIDADSVYHQLTSSKSPCLDALVAEFGTEILSNDGSLNRKKLFSTVFYSGDVSAKQNRLNKITHKFVLERIREIIDEYKKLGAPAVLVDAPLLFESEFNKECDIIISVIAEKSIRTERIIKRDGITLSEAEKRINSQLSDDFLIDNSNYVIKNNKGIEELKDAVQSIAKQIMNITNKEK